MSDTHLDEDLEKKKSARFPEWLFERIQQFRDDYNETLDGLDTDTDALQLDTDSDAQRRLIDLGLLAWYDPDYDVDFSAPPTDDTFVCPKCGASSSNNRFRVRLDMGSDFKEVSTMRCLECDHEADPDRFESTPLVDF